MAARWEEFDFEAASWDIPAERMKKRKAHVIPLPRQAVELLRNMQGVTGQHAHLFPNRNNRTKPMTVATMRQALRYLGWSGRYSPHATRTTGSTRLNEIGYPADWMERQLAHTETNSARRSYNQADYLADRGKMMQQWADMLDSWRDGSTVVPLNTAAG